MFWRGGSWKPTYATVVNKNWDWSPVQEVISGEGARPYIKYVSDSSSRIHMAFTDGHPRNEQTNSIYYACMYRGDLYKGNFSLSDLI